MPGKIAYFFVMILSFCFSLAADADGAATLQAKIHTTAVMPPPSQTVVIQPGSSVLLKTVVTNVGNKANAPGEIFIRFQFPEPLHHHSESLLFETEKQPLPSLLPGEQTEIPFAKLHVWPSLFDYIRDDWGMREYQVIAKVGEAEQKIGKLLITFSAYYYEGPSIEIPTPVMPVQMH